MSGRAVNRERLVDPWRRAGPAWIAALSLRVTARADPVGTLLAPSNGFVYAATRLAHVSLLSLPEAITPAWAVIELDLRIARNRSWTSESASRYRQVRSQSRVSLAACLVR